MWVSLVKMVVEDLVNDVGFRLVCLIVFYDVFSSSCCCGLIEVVFCLLILKNLVLKLVMLLRNLFYWDIDCLGIFGLGL